MKTSTKLVLSLASSIFLALMTQTIFATNSKTETFSQNPSARVNETVTNRAKVKKARTRKKARSATNQSARRGNTRVRNLLPYMEQSNLKKTPRARH